MSPGLNPRPILLVEDNPDDLDLTLRAFRQRDLANPIEVARDGQEALDWIPRWEAGAERPLVILLDIKLPRVNGLEVLQKLRQHPVSRNIPVVMLTSSEDERDVSSAYAHHASSYIVKPVNFDHLLTVADQIKSYWCLINHPPD